MNNQVFKRLLDCIKNEQDIFEALVSADNSSDLNVNSSEIINYLEFSKEDNALSGPIVGNIIITEGDILSVLRIIHDLILHNGTFTLFINSDNLGTITYLIEKVNKIYQELNVNVTINLDYSKNYNSHLNSLVTIIGSADFVKTASKDFKNPNQLIM